MKKSHKFFIVASVIGAFTAVAGFPVQAKAAIVLDTTGSDNAANNDFYGVMFESGAGSVETMTFDVAGTPGAMFDFDGTGSFANGTNAVLRLPSLVGLSASDVNFSWTGLAGHPTVLTVNFAAGSFRAGDSFRFAADTDALISDPASGRVFGMGNVSVTVKMEGGDQASANFHQVSSTSSVAQVAVVPEPATMIMLLVGAGIGLMRRGR